LTHVDNAVSWAKNYELLVSHSAGCKNGLLIMGLTGASDSGVTSRARVKASGESEDLRRCDLGWAWVERGVATGRLLMCFARRRRSLRMKCGHVMPKFGFHINFGSAEGRTVLTCSSRAKIKLKNKVSSKCTQKLEKCQGRTENPPVFFWEHSFCKQRGKV
jgi:hypothetical protein